MQLLSVLSSSQRTDSFRGLRARGGMKVDPAREDSQGLSATLKAFSDGAVTVVAPKVQTVGGVTGQGQCATRKLNADGSVLIETKSGRTYFVQLKQGLPEERFRQFR